jgi:predicted PhzF superfamily epimerase YddE/YHI9
MKLPFCTVDVFTEQRFGGRPGIIYLETDMAKGAVTAARVGGTAIRLSDGALR